MANNDTSLRNVVNLLRNLYYHKGSYLSTEYLESLGIMVSAMDFETGRPADSGPQFCEPYPSEQFDRVFEFDKLYEASKDFGPLDEGDVYCTALGIGTIIDNFLHDMGMYVGFEPSERICPYLARS